MKSIVLFSICFLSFSLSANAKKGPEIKIVDATTQHWVSGMPVKEKAGHGEHYVIKVYVNTTKEIKFAKLWIGEKNVPFQLQFVNSPVPEKIAQGDSLLLDYNTSSGDEKPVLPVPASYKGAAVIECLIAGKPHYFVVKEFRKVPDFSGR